MKWNKEHPEAPEGGKSDWYWFYSEEDKSPSIQEIWPNRRWWRKGWWGDKIKQPIRLPKNKERIEE